MSESDGDTNNNINYDHMVINGFSLRTNYTKINKQNTSILYQSNGNVEHGIYNIYH